MSMIRNSALAAALLGAAAFFPVPSLALDDDVDVEVEADRPGLLPGEPLDPDADVTVETPEDEADINIEADKD